MKSLARSLIEEFDVISMRDRHNRMKNQWLHDSLKIENGDFIGEMENKLEDLSLHTNKFKELTFVIGLANEGLNLLKNMYSSYSKSDLYFGDERKNISELEKDLKYFIETSERFVQASLKNDQKWSSHFDDKMRNAATELSADIRLMSK